MAAIPRAAEPGAAAPGATASQVQLPPVVAAEHQAAVAAFREAYAALPAGAPVRLAKRTSNLFRFREPAPRAGGRRGPQGPGTAAGWTRPRSPACCTWTRPPGPPWWVA